MVVQFDHVVMVRAVVVEGNLVLGVLLELICHEHVFDNHFFDQVLQSALTEFSSYLIIH